MTKETEGGLTNSTSNNKSEQDNAVKQSKHKTSVKKGANASEKTLGRKEKLEAIKKANQAMMNAWKLISQRTKGETDAQNNL